MSNKKKSILYLVVSFLLLGLTAIPVYSWLVGTEHKAHIGEVEINIPPIIYIRDDDLEEMNSFHLDGLQINNEYNFVFCVAPARRNVVRNFLLGVIYTENIGMIIDIYPVTSIDTSSTPKNSTDLVEVRTLDNSSYNSGSTTQDICFHYTTQDSVWNSKCEISYADTDGESATGVLDLNRGLQKMYKGLAFDTTNENWEYDTLLKELTDDSHYVFYVMSITWDAEKTQVDANKEVDIVYIITKGTAKND